MKILVIGASAGTGRATVEQLLAEGHEVSAFSRRASKIGISSERLRAIDGDVMDPSAVERAVEGQQAVIVTLGIRENPLRVRLWGPAHTPLDVRSTGTRNVIAAMKKHGVKRLVVQTSYGVAETRAKLRASDRLFFALILKPQIADTEQQNQIVVESDLEWVIAQPVHLTDEPDSAMPLISTTGETGKMTVSRASVARFLVQAAQSPSFVRKSLALSGHVIESARERSAAAPPRARPAARASGRGL